MRRGIRDRLGFAIDLDTKLGKMRGGKDTKAEIEMMKQDAAAFQQQLDDAQSAANLASSSFSKLPRLRLASSAGTT